MITSYNLGPVGRSEQMQSTSCFLRSCVLFRRLFSFLLLLCFIYQQQSFWLICHHVLPVWTVEDVERFPFSCSQQGVLSLLSNVEPPLTGNNKLAHCVWHNLFSV